MDLGVDDLIVQIAVYFGLCVAAEGTVLVCSG